MEYRDCVPAHVQQIQSKTNRRKQFVVHQALHSTQVAWNQPRDRFGGSEAVAHGPWIQVDEANSVVLDGDGPYDFCSPNDPQSSLKS